MQRFDVSRENGQTMTEYSVVLAVITIAALSALTLLGDQIVSALERVAAILSL